MDDHDPFLASVRRHLNRIAPLGDEEAAAVLRVASAAAHASERRFAPLTCYLAGLALGERPLNERLEVLRALVDFIEPSD